MTGIRRTRMIRSIFLQAAGLLIVLWSVGPFLWQVSTSLQAGRMLMETPPSLLPLPPTFEHFYNVFVAKQFHWYILNSVFITGATNLLCLVFGTLGAFALARFDMRGRYGVLGLILSISMFPQIAIVAPLYLTMSSLQLLDTYTSLIVIDLALPLVIWVLFGYLHAIPREIDEAATVDGAGPMRTLWLIFLPMALPGIVTTGLLVFIATWNEFMFALAFTSTIDRQPIPVGIANFQNLYCVPWGDLAAASVAVTLLLVAMVLVFQRRIIAGLTQGAVKE